MSDNNLQTDLEALNRFIVDCPELEKLEALLGGFNLFQVLKFEYGEIRHSNVLAWLLDPAESHGLGQAFIQRLLMRILHESDKTTNITPVDIHCWQPVSFEIRREWNHIDLLCVVTLTGGETWVVCIENKVNALQRLNQLVDYRKVVEDYFPDAKRRLYILLSKNREEPEDEEYHIADYNQVHRTLSDCLASREHAVGSEPKVLIENYLQLLEEKFMNESEIASTARMIYQQHKRALDIIFENRPDLMRELSAELFKLIEDHAEERGIVPVLANKKYLYFIPESWSHPGNTHGTAFKTSERSLSMEIHIDMGSAFFVVCSWKNPEPWTDRVWQIASEFPFSRPSKSDNPPNYSWCHLHSVNLRVVPADMESNSPSEVALVIFEKAMAELASPQTQQIIQILAAELPALDEAYQTQGN
ncbi:MAG: PD-(D/E)XK nuclease family protein [Luteolibacter sp.]